MIEKLTICILIVVIHFGLVYKKYKNNIIGVETSYEYY